MPTFPGEVFAAGLDVFGAVADRLEPGDWWQALAAEARAALAGADLDLEMDTPMGPRTVGDRLAFPAIDLYVHAWTGRAPR